METLNTFRSLTEGACGIRLTFGPVRNLLLMGAVVLGTAASARAAVSQEPLPPMTAEERRAWLLSPEGVHWTSPEFAQERTACVMMRGRVDIMRAVVEHVILGMPHGEDPVELASVRRALHSEPFEVHVRRGLRMNMYEERKVDDGDAVALALPLAGALRASGLDSRGDGEAPPTRDPSNPAEVGEHARYLVVLSHPGSLGNWIHSSMTVEDRETGELIFDGSARLARVGGEWRVAGWGPTVAVGRLLWESYEEIWGPYLDNPCPS
jgi:hypothetical protein